MSGQKLFIEHVRYSTQKKMVWEHIKNAVSTKATTLYSMEHGCYPKYVFPFFYGDSVLLAYVVIVNNKKTLYILGFTIVCT